VTESSLTLGMFVTNLHILSQTGNAWSKIYSILLDMQGAFPALARMVVLLNLPTYMGQLRALNRHRRHITKEQRQTELRKMSAMKVDTIAPVDKLRIQIENVEFAYLRRYQDAVSDLSAHMNCKGSLTVEQGKLVALIGPQGGGKSTLLKLLGGVILPEAGRGILFVLSHLRVLHVSAVPMFFKGTLYQNMAFGVMPGTEDARLDHIIAICRCLGVITTQQLEIMHYMTSKESYDWNEVLSQSQAHLLCLARALIANPEVMCVHKPMACLDESRSKRVMEVLRRNVVEKGIEQDASQIHARRPRTCFVTCHNHHGLDQADSMFHISRNGGIVPFERKHLKLSMFA